MDLLELQRRLKNENPNLAYIIATLWERQTDLNKQLDTVAESLTSLARSLETITHHQFGLDEKFARLKKRAEEVESVNIFDDPEGEG